MAKVRSNHIGRIIALIAGLMLAVGLMAAPAVAGAADGTDGSNRLTATTLGSSNKSGYAIECSWSANEELQNYPLMAIPDQAADGANVRLYGPKSVKSTSGKDYVLDALTVKQGDVEVAVTRADVSDNEFRYEFRMPAGDVKAEASFLEKDALWVGGVRVTDGNASNIPCGTAADGCVSCTGEACYDKASHTLTLTDYQCEFRGKNEERITSAITYAGSDQLTIVLEGKNILKAVRKDAGDNAFAGIDSVGPLVIQGDGRLFATGADGAFTSSALYCQAELTVESGTVIAAGGTSESGYSYGINCTDVRRFLMKGGTVSARGNSAMVESAGIKCWTAGLSGGTIVAVDGSETETANRYGVHGFVGVGEGITKFEAIGRSGVAASSESTCFEAYIEGKLWTNADGTGEGRLLHRYESLYDASKYKKALFPYPVSTPWATLEDALAAGGTVTLIEDVEYDGASGPLVVPAGKEVILDLNGFSIDRKQAANTVITVEAGGKLALEDTAGGGKITGGNNNSFGCGVLVQGTLVMNGGAIVGNGAGLPGVKVDGGAFTLNGGSIEGYDGVFNGGTFTMTGGAVNGNTDGVYLNASSVFTLSGGKITGGANGVNYVDGVFNLSGNPTITSTGIGVFLFHDRLINITGALSNKVPISVELMYDMDVFTSGYSDYNSADPSQWFTGSKHVVSLTADGREAQLGYSVTCKRAQHGAVGADKSMADAGDTVAISTLPDENYELDTLTVTSEGKSVEVKDGAFTMPSGNVTVSATFKLVQHTVTYRVKNGTWADGTTTDKTEKIAHGAKPAAVPTGMRASTGYDNGAWDKNPTAAAVTADAAFTYAFMPNEYAVKFVDDDGTVLQSAKVAYGKTPKYAGKTPTKVPNAQFTYKFKGWTPKVSKVIGDTTYKATYEAIPIAVAPLAKMVAKGKAGLSITWTGTPGADGYDVFFSRCNHDGKKVVPKAVATVKAGGTLSWTATGLKKGAPYKARVRAFVVEGGKKRYIGTSLGVHMYTSGGSSRNTNATGVKVNRSKVALAKGGSFKLIVSVTKADKKRRLMPTKHAAHIRYLSTNKSVATVSANGKITAKGKGTCYVYVCAHNGVSKRVEVTVR
ncbi:MAG: Ig-like domain-containing protein [Eggerthellaceae bacterium]|nr:Ig-like domain-containing protein [Eggerthellaceae bacterium]